MCWILDAKHRVHQRGEVSEVDASHCAIELIQRPRFSALQDPNPCQMPVVGEVGCKIVPLYRVRHVDLEVGAEDVRTVEVRRCPGIAKPLRIVTGEEKA